MKSREGLSLARFFVFFVIPLYQRSGSGDCLKNKKNFLSFDLLPKCTAGLGEDLFSIRGKVLFVYLISLT
uniref:Uncharacterized protein n=1 Tax=Utricularia reniformis TaxID=192314 RepID=A0A1Y0AYY1_9LAMI|nr:hypothetical protein AEK19_MT1268 [Utricularia reniformis]ART30364.1 hypothetical protein AEK19_MT1268 [Utricularia reniformis]